MSIHKRIITANQREILVCSDGMIYEWNRRNDSWTRKTEYVDKHGYHRVVINHRYYRVHRLVAFAFGISASLEKIQGLDIDHIDDNPENNKLSNLQLISSKENRAKQARHQRSLMNYEYAIYKLVQTEVAVAYTGSIVDAAKFIGVDRSYACQVVNGKRKQCNGYTIKKIKKEER